MLQPEPMNTNTTPPIDEILALVTSAENSSQLKTLLVQLNYLNKASLLSYTSDGLDPLTILNPSTHSLGYLYFITARCQDARSETALQLYQLLSHFIQVFNPEQIHLAPDKYALVGKALLHLTKVLQKPSLPLQVFVTAIQRFTDSPYTITPLHAPFIQACILAKHYSYPLYLLDHDIEIVNASYSIGIQSFLQYYYYGAIIYIGCQNYERALDFLSIVISAPTQKAISAIQIAAYKKFVLVSLIQQGSIRSLPKYSSPGVEKICKSQHPAYFKLVKAFSDSDLHLFNEIASSSSNAYLADNHIGLIKQCYQSLLRKKIKELTKVYITVGLIEMASKIGDVTAEQLELILIEMINQKQIYATLSVTDELVKMVHFSDEEEDLKHLDLEERILQIATLNDRVSYMDKLEGLNKDFQTKYMTLSANGGQMASTPYDEDFDLPLDDDTIKF